MEITVANLRKMCWKILCGFYWKLLFKNLAVLQSLLRTTSATRRCIKQQISQDTCTVHRQNVTLLRSDIGCVRYLRVSE